MERINNLIWTILFVFSLSFVLESHVFAGQLHNVDAYVTDWTGTEYFVREIYPDNHPNTRAFYVRHENSTITLAFSKIKQIIVTDRFLVTDSEHMLARQYHCFGEIILRDNHTLNCSWTPTGWKGGNNFGGNIFIGRNHWKEIRFSDSSLVNCSQVSADPGLYPYTIHVCSFRNKNVSNRIAMKLRKKGIPAFTCRTQIPGKGNFYRIFIGFFRTLQETRKAALELKGQKALYPLEAKMPYAITLGTFDSDQELRKLEANLQSRAYLAYTIPDKPDTSRTRLLIGAFRTEKDTVELTKALQKEGFTPRVVSR